MHQSLSLLTIAAAFAVVLSACRQQPSGPVSSVGDIIKPSPAHPALTYYGLAKSGDSTYPAIYVMDADVRNQTSVFVASSNMVQFLSPSWSPTGQSICFTQWGNGACPDSIKVVDVACIAQGLPEGTNQRTIIGLSSPGTILGGLGTGTTLGYAYWSSTAAMGKIAYTTTNEDKISLCVIPETGGSPTVLWSGNWWDDYGYCAWSPDDSRLAFCVDLPYWDNNAILIFNTSDWTCIDTIKVSGSIRGLDWSRSGLNKLLFARAKNYVEPYYLYYCDPNTGATPTTNGFVGTLPTWSPDNSSILCDNNGLTKVTPFTRSTTVVDLAIKSSVKWKR